MSAAALGVAKMLPLMLDAIVLLAIVAAMFSVDGLAEHQIMPPETLYIIGRLNQESKLFQKRRGVFGLWVERIEIWSLDFGGIAVAAAPLAVAVQALPAVADSGPDLAPSGLGSQPVNHHASAIAGGLVAV